MDAVRDIDSIISHIGEGANRCYLVLWKKSNIVSWVPVCDFFDKQCISAYMLDFNKRMNPSFFGDKKD